MFEVGLDIILLATAPAPARAAAPLMPFFNNAPPTALATGTIAAGMISSTCSTSYELVFSMFANFCNLSNSDCKPVSSAFSSEFF